MGDRPEVLREYRVKIIPAADAGPQAVYPDDLGLCTKFGGAPDAGLLMEGVCSTLRRLFAGNLVSE